MLQPLQMFMGKGTFLNKSIFSEVFKKMTKKTNLVKEHSQHLCTGQDTGKTIKTKNPHIRQKIIFYPLQFALCPDSAMRARGSHGAQRLAWDSPLAYKSGDKHLQLSLISELPF